MKIILSSLLQIDKIYNIIKEASDYTWTYNKSIHLQRIMTNMTIMKTTNKKTILFYTLTTNYGGRNMT